MGTAKKFLFRIVDFLRRSSLIGRLMMEKSLMERNRRHLFQHLGELTYSLYKTKKIKEESLFELVSEIDVMNQSIRDKWSNLENHIHKD